MLKGVAFIGGSVADAGEDEIALCQRVGAKRSDCKALGAILSHQRPRIVSSTGAAFQGFLARGPRWC